MIGDFVVSGAIEMAARAGQAVADGAVDAGYGMKNMLKGQNLVSIANTGRVEPITMIDSDVVNLDYISDVMQSVHAIFSGYYMQAINLTNQVGNVSVIERLKPFNPNTGLLSYAKAKASIALGLFQKKQTQLALESVSVDTDVEKYKELSTNANLSVGKMFKVTLKGSGKDSVEIPIAIRLLVNVLPSTLLSEYFTYRDSFDMSMKERWHAWREGRLSFWSDLVLCNDLLDKYRKMAIKDKTGLGQTMLDREANQVARALKGHDSYATATNIAVVSDETMSLVESKINGRFSNFKVRQAVFDNSNLMLLVVVDKQWDRCTIYTRGIDASTTLSVKDMKNSSKGSGPDVAEIMKAYLAGSSPNFH